MRARGPELRPDRTGHRPPAQHGVREGERKAELGREPFSRLKELLLRVWDSPLAR